jgi:dihydrofolate reductase
MRVTFYSIPTANGLIAMDGEEDYGFISDSSWDNYLKTLKEAGVFIMGRRTYEASLRTGAFPYPDCLNVVMTSQKIENKWGDKTMFTGRPPREVIQMLEGMGFKKAVVTGGRLSASFMKEGLVDEVWIDLMPRIFGKGIALFSGDFDTNVELLSANTSGNEVQLRYKVVK